MDTSGLSDHVSDILQDYYKNTFGGAETGTKVESLIIRGKLLTPEGNLSSLRKLRKSPT